MAAISIFIKLIQENKSFEAKYVSLEKRTNYSLVIFVSCHFVFKSIVHHPDLFRQICEPSA